MEKISDATKSWALANLLDDTDNLITPAQLATMRASDPAIGREIADLRKSVATLLAKVDPGPETVVPFRIPATPEDRLVLLTTILARNEAAAKDARFLLAARQGTTPSDADVTAMLEALGLLGLLDNDAGN